MENLLKNDATDKSNGSNNTSSNEDWAIFGMISEGVADVFHDRAESVLSGCVSSLPLLSSTTGGEIVLLEKLRKVYARNIDLFKLYCGRNIFTTSIFPPRRRLSIVQLYDDTSFDPVSCNSFCTSSVTHKGDEDNTTYYAELPPIPPIIRTSQDVETIQKQTMDLRHHLKALKRRRMEIYAIVDTLNVAKEMLDIAESTIDENKTELNVINEQVLAAVASSQNLKDLREKGERLKERMVELRNERYGKNDEASASDELEQYDQPSKSKGSTRDIEKLSWEAKYQRDRAVFQDLDQVHNLLKKDS